MKQANGEIDAFEDDDDSEDSEEGEDEFKGFEEPEPINQEDEYIDEDKYTTVTIESVGISREGFSRPGDVDEEAAAAKAAAIEATEDLSKDVTAGKHEIKRDANGKRIWTKERPRTEWPKKKKKKFRYETKAERKVERAKQGAKKKKLREARSKKE